jgi:hypothetical protein
MPVAARVRFPYDRPMNTRWGSRIRTVFLAGLGVLFAPFSTPGHHATAVDYDISKTVVLKGRIARVDWFNPHIHVYLDVKVDSHDETWSVEFPSPGATIVAGLSKQQLGPGTELTFEGYPSRDDLRMSRSASNSRPDPQHDPQHFACARTITLSDGSRYAFVLGI